MNKMKEKQLQNTLFLKDISNKEVRDYTIIDYRIFCLNWDLKMDKYSSLLYFKRFCSGDFKVLLELW